jgi:hypothetical protein
MWLIWYVAATVPVLRTVMFTFTVLGALGRNPRDRLGGETLVVPRIA